jgi:hypothetical protein
MKRFVELIRSHLWLAFVIAFASALVYQAGAQELGEVTVSVDPAQVAEIGLLAWGWKAWGVLRELQHQSPLVAAYSLVQILLLFMGTALSNRLGIVKLTIVSALNVLVGVLSSRVAGQEWLEAATSAGSMAAISVFLHQFKSQISKMPEQKAALGEANSKE